jgi:hypothetical protein
MKKSLVITSIIIIVILVASILYIARENIRFVFNKNYSSNGTCTDSDGGINYYVKGDTKGILGGPGNIVGGEDNCSCLSTGENCKLLEYYCKNGYVVYKQYNCPNGCKDGACIK